MAARRRRRRNPGTNPNSLPISHPPPWSLADLKKKKKAALSLMVQDWQIDVVGSLKNDFLRALHQFSNDYDNDNDDDDDDTDDASNNEDSVFDDDDGYQQLPQSGVMDIEDEVNLDLTRLLDEMEEQRPDMGIFDMDLVSDAEHDGSSILPPQDNNTEVNADENNGLALDDDDDIDIPRNPEARRLGVMEIGDNMDNISLWCLQHNMSEMAQIFKAAGFEEIKYVIMMTRADLESLELNLGQCIKLLSLFEEEKEINKQNFNIGNNHYIRRIQSNDDNNNNNDNPNNDDDANWLQENINGTRRIKYTGPMPSNGLQRKCRDIVFNIIMVKSRDTDIKKIRKKVCNRTKNGEVAQVRYYFDDNTKDWPNAPINLVYGALKKLENLSFLVINILLNHMVVMLR